MKYSRRDVMRMGLALAGGLGLQAGHGRVFAAGLEKIFSGQTQVFWLQGMSCSGCSVALLDSMDPGPAELVTEVISLVFHSNLSAAQGEDVARLTEEVGRNGGHVVVVEGALPAADPEMCVIGGKPVTEILPPLARSALAVIAAGSCASFGGIPAAEGNPTGAVGVKTFLESRGIPVQNRLVNCPGCPAHPAALVATIAHLIGKGYPKVDPVLLAPRMAYHCSVHDECPRFHCWEKREFARHFGDEGCLFQLGCLGPLSHTNCPRHQWNGGVNWCIRAGAPCIACTSPEFARRKDFAFYRQGEQYHPVAYQEADRKGAKS